MTSIKDKAGEEYWSTVWKNSPLPPPVKFNTGKINDYPDKVLHKIFVKIFAGMNTRGMKLLEIGCGNSVLITYLAQQFGFEVTGLDYSEKGCQQSRLILEREKVKGNIICQDAFNPSPDLLNQFDVVCSFGVVEHFSDTSGTIKAFSNFLKPGGLLVTSLPNMSSVTGNLHKYLNRPVYDIHVPLDKNQIEMAIEKAGLKLKFSSYFLAISFAITLEGLNGEKIKNYSLKRFFIKTLRYGSKLIWMVENKLGTIPPGKIFSGGIITSAQK